MRPSNDDLLAAHAAGDKETLVRIYTALADQREAEDAVDAACFYLTQAYVFALEIGHPSVEALHARLVTHGREV